MEDNIQRIVISDAEFFTVLKAVRSLSSDFKKNEFLDQYFYHNRALTSDMLAILLDEISFASSKAELVLDLEGKVVPPKKRKTVKIEKRNNLFPFFVALVLSNMISFIFGSAFILIVLGVKG